MKEKVNCSLKMKEEKMACLQVYAWESQKWPRFLKVKLDVGQQKGLLFKLARHFKVNEPMLSYSHKRGANAKHSENGAAGSYEHRAWGSVIRLGSITTLGTLCHEFAHHLNWSRWRKGGHGRTFKRELKRTYTFAKRYLPSTLEPVATE